MLKRMLVTLVASAFALGAYAQADKSGTTKAEPKGQSAATTKKAEPGKGTAKGDAKPAKATKTTKTTKTKSKDNAKDATKDAKAK